MYIVKMCSQRTTVTLLGTQVEYGSKNSFTGQNFSRGIFCLTVFNVYEKCSTVCQRRIKCVKGSANNKV